MEQATEKKKKKKKKKRKKKKKKRQTKERKEPMIRTSGFGSLSFKFSSALSTMNSDVRPNSFSSSRSGCDRPAIQTRNRQLMK
jgi:hypothetical protein